MGCDIHIYAEQKNDKGEWELMYDIEPFSNRQYSIFAWLANVRNYSGLIPISEPMGFPEDASPQVAADYNAWGCDAHTPSWLSVKELLNFNYDAPCEDRRVTVKTGPNSWNGGATCNQGEGRQTTYRELFGEDFFEDLNKLRAFGAERIVFWFDN